MSEQITQVTIVDKDILELLPGEVTDDGKRRSWFVGCPRCKEPGALAKHQSTYDEGAGLLTISPSILCRCGAHYFIERNQIRWV
jgi:uncharacterized protein DUF6527